MVEPLDADPIDAVEHAESIENILLDAGVTLEQVHHGDGIASWAVNRRAIPRGHGIRTGLEDTPVLPDGRQALGNGRSRSGLAVRGPPLIDPRLERSRRPVRLSATTDPEAVSGRPVATRGTCSLRSQQSRRRAGISVAWSGHWTRWSTCPMGRCAGAGLGERGHPIVLVHGTPYSSFLWPDIAPALAHSRQVYVFDLLGYGQSDKHDGQDLTLAAQARNFTRLLEHWGLAAPSVVANDIGGAIVLRALLLEGARYSDLDVVRLRERRTRERGLFAQIREKHEVFERLPAYAHEALVTSHLRNGSHIGYRPGVLETYLAPWLGEVGQAAFYRQYRQLAQTDTDGYEHLLADIDIPVRLLWGREDQSCRHRTANGCAIASSTSACDGSMMPGICCRRTLPPSC